MKRLLILDSNSIINRAYYGVRFLSASDGLQTNALYGFMNIFMKLLNSHKPDFVCAAFDLKAPTFRHKMYSGYKAQRKPMPDSLAAQMPFARDLVRAMNIPLLEMKGYEADDIIGTVSRICAENGVECLIATGDKDDLQLASDTTRVLLTVTSHGTTETTEYDADAVFERYGVSPSEFVDVKALMGDSSDNIPGVKGIGEKTATKIIAAVHSIERLYENPEAAPIKGAVLEKIKNGRDDAFLSKKLSAINCRVPIDFDISSCGFSGIKEQSSEELYEILKRLELNSVIKRLNLDTPKSDINTSLLSDLKIERTIGELHGTVSLIADHDGRHIRAVAVYDGSTAYVMTEDSAAQEELLAALKRIGEDEGLKKIVFDIKNTMVTFDKIIEFRGIEDDVAIAQYLVDPARGKYELEQLAAEYFNIIIAREGGSQISFFAQEEQNADYYAQSAAALFLLRDAVMKKIERNNQMQLYREAELPLVRVLAKMQIYGFLVDEAELDAFSKKVAEKVAGLTQEIYSLAGETFNLNSSKQLGDILFEKLKLGQGKKNRHGYSTNAEVLENLADKHPIVPLILEYRQYSKLKSTYCDGLKAVINPDDHRIHSVFTQTVTVTGRISSTEPNLQNIPTRTQLGREMRRMFIAQPGYTLVDADYSQIELRILADIADDKAMQEAFGTDTDIHAYTAARVLKIPVEQVTPEQRSAAKAVNFGIVYGIGEFSLAKDIHSTTAEAREYIRSYLEKYSGVHDYMNDIKARAKRDGYVKTMMNRIRYIPELRSSNFNVRAFGERVALNTPIQGSSADIIKLAMVRVCRALEKMKSRLILQVHDELIVEAENSEVEEVKRILKETMENAAKLKVPLVVDMSEGKSWYEAK